jgi:hypothetical protein
MARLDEATAALRALDPLADEYVEPPSFGAVAERVRSATMPPPPSRGRRRRPPRGLVLILALLVASGTAAALAASGLIGVGRPASFEAEAPSSPSSGIGVALGGSDGLLPLRVMDPAGGPPWGMRYFTTSRGLGCVEVGRVVGGRIGLLGRDGIADDDGLLHPFAAGSYQADLCAPRDGTGHTFLAVSGSGFYAAGVPFDGYPCSFGPRVTRKGCPAADRRELLFGLTGPDGRSVSYRVRGRSHTAGTVGPDGAYLIVLTPQGPYEGSMGTAPMPAAPITAVSYADGRTCRVSEAVRGPGVGSCGLEGYVAPRPPAIPRDGLRTPLSASAGPERGAHHRYRVVRVSFRAPVAIGNTNAQYELRLSPGGPCSGASFGSQTEADIRRGQWVVLEAELPLRQTRRSSRPGARCDAVTHGEVWLATPSRNAAAAIDLVGEGSPPTAGNTLGHFVLRP